MSTKIKKKTGIVWAIAAAILLAVAAGTYFLLQETQGKAPAAEVLTAATLEEIIQVSELSTFTAVYNGVAEIMPEKEAEPVSTAVPATEKTGLWGGVVSTANEILSKAKDSIEQVTSRPVSDGPDYYVSYEAKVKAGIDFEQVSIEVDNEGKTITVTIPEITITEVNVNIASLDYIFVNEKANTAMVSQTAFKACEEDARQEVERQADVFSLARQNAENVLRALIAPVVDQLDAEYTLIMR